jgi:hypothetical protein
MVPGCMGGFATKRKVRARRIDNRVLLKDGDPVAESTEGLRKGDNRFKICSCDGCPCISCCRVLLSADLDSLSHRVFPRVEDEFAPLEHLVDL